MTQRGRARMCGLGRNIKSRDLRKEGANFACLKNLIKIRMAHCFVDYPAPEGSLKANI